MFELSPAVLDLLVPTAEIIIKAVVLLVFSFAGGKEFVQILTSLVKRIPQLQVVSSPTIAFGVSTAVAFGLITATHFGFANQFESALAGLTTILAGVFGTRLLVSQSHETYTADRANGLAVFGASRSKEVFSPPVDITARG